MVVLIDIDEAENSPFPINARYSDNAAAILKLASQKATIESKGLVGTEDLLWATFAASQEKSRSNAVKQVREKVPLPYEMSSFTLKQSLPLPPSFKNGA